MTTFPIDLPDSFRFLTALQDAVSDNVVEAMDARGQILVQDHGASQWKGNFTLPPMLVNGQMYRDWRTFVSRIQQTLGTFKMPPVDIVTGRRYGNPRCDCSFAPAPAGSTVLTVHNNLTGRQSAGIRWFRYEENLYEIISDRPVFRQRPDERIITINPPLVTPIEYIIVIAFPFVEPYCIARATTITHPTLTTNGTYQGAGIFWEQDIQI